MELYSKHYEEKKMVFDEKERDLMGDCANLIESLMTDFKEMNEGVNSKITLPSPDDDGDYCEYTGYEFYSALWEARYLLSNLQMRGVIVGRGEVEEK